ncbi:hypothetical protein Clacol_004567 [Clathrus columnatus]|uniref:S-adenosyl-L-homocysteine hydrolase NAD binding domain-containing protein n=1 Tax=Clathrus columnatus TaxID=1419009 RepID=A0AAV5ACX5_9AGAM|nr:hypothetical protein Clacol_004567 [Clathrus columnatus]
MASDVGFRIAATGVPAFAWKGETEEEYTWCIEQMLTAFPRTSLTTVVILPLLLYTRNIDIHGISEETTIGIHHLYRSFLESKLKVPAINITITLAVNLLSMVLNAGCHAGKVAIIAGYSDVGKGSVVNIKPQVDCYLPKNGRHILLLAENRLVNLGCAKTDHLSFVMSCSFSNQVLAQMAVWQTPRKFPLGGLEEEVARAR